jgi:DNA-binding FadR family transcriptional regulator
MILECYTLFNHQINTIIMNILDNNFIKYLISSKNENGKRLPSLAELSNKLGISVAALREQLEIAKLLGLVEVKPKIGIRQKVYTFTPAVLASALYATAVDVSNFDHIANLRMHLEEAYWFEAVGLLQDEDKAKLREYVVNAKHKLIGKPAQIPQQEHRGLHLTIYSRLSNPFVYGLLECYWELYEAVGLNVYSDMGYLNSVWDYHDRIVMAIDVGELGLGFQLLKEHMKLIQTRSKEMPSQSFE